MGLDIFFLEDIRNALMAANEASSATAAMMNAPDDWTDKMRVYRQGYKAALTTVALAFGLSPSIIETPTPGDSPAPSKAIDIPTVLKLATEVIAREE